MTTLAISLPMTVAEPGLALLLRLKLRLLRNRVRQMADQSPLRLLLVLLFIAVIWAALYGVFDYVFTFLRRSEQEAAVAVPYVFHVFFVAMTFLLTFSAAVLAYSALFGRQEPSFLLVTPSSPRSIVTVMYLESLFFSSWSLLLLGMPLMLAIGQVQGLPWHFYATFIVAFLGFVPIPGAFGLLAAMAVALWLPRFAKRTLFYSSFVLLIGLLVWWSRLWGLSAADSNEWLHEFLGELSYLKAALLPSTWVTNAIQLAIEDKPADAAFYLAVTLANALFLSNVAVHFSGRRLVAAYARASTAAGPGALRHGWASRWITRVVFFYLPAKARALVLKDVRNFLRDPVQWSQLAILLGLLGLYLFYLPRSRPQGFSQPWQALICFLNYGAVTLIMSTFTSRFVFPMVSMEGRQMWLVGLWPMSRSGVMWAKFAYAFTVTAGAAMSVTVLSIHALRLPPALALVQAGGTLATCIGLCGMAVGLGAKLPNYSEPSAGRVASGLGGTVNLIASVALVALSVALVGTLCFRMVEAGTLLRLDGTNWLLFGGTVLLGLVAGLASMGLGIGTFRRQEF